MTNSNKKANLALRAGKGLAKLIFATIAFIMKMAAFMILQAILWRVQRLVSTAIWVAALYWVSGAN